jgi:mevalonate pyrophosphate decarboxylase
MPTNHYPREVYRRKQCATVTDIFGRMQRSAAPSVMESLVSSATTRGKLPSVQRDARIASRPAKRATADGYADFKSPEHNRSENQAEISGRSEFRNKEAAQ